MSDIAKELEKIAKQLGVDTRRSIIQAAKELGVKSALIKTWEEFFPQIKPKLENEKKSYYNKDIETLKKIKNFLEKNDLEISDLHKIFEKSGGENLDSFLDKEPQKNKIRAIEIDDFISEEHDLLVEIEGHSKVNPKAKIMDFFDIEIGEIDPQTKRELKENIAGIRQKLKNLKTGLESF